MNGEETRETSKDREKKAKMVERSLGVAFFLSITLSTGFFAWAASLVWGLTGVLTVFGVAFFIVAIFVGTALGNS